MTDRKRARKEATVVEQNKSSKRGLKSYKLGGIFQAFSQEKTL